MGVLALLDWRLLASALATATLLALALRRVLRGDARDDALVTLLAAGVLFAQAALYFGYTVDDSFISFRFARNWTEGIGPVYQPGDRVEGFTSFLWVAALALAGRVGLDVETTSKVVGVVAALAAVFLVARLARALRPGTSAALLAPLVLATSPLFAAWAPAGMEAPLVAAALAAAALRFVHETKSPGAFPWSAMLFGAFVLLRPEGFLFAAVAALALPGRARLYWIALFAAVAAPYWLARWAYYGQPLPNTFYAKTGMGAGQLLAGLVSLFDFVSDAGLLTTLLVALGFAQARWREAGDRFVFGSLAAFLAYLVAVGGDVLHLRFYVHVLPLWAVAAAIGLERVLEAARGLDARAFGALRRPALAAVALAILCTVVVHHEHARALAGRSQFGAAYVVDNSNNIHRAHMPLGDWLALHAPPGARAAVTDIGGLGWRSRMKIVDLYGLTDRAIARLVHERAAPAQWTEHLRAVRPEFFVLYGNSKAANLASTGADHAWIDREYRMHSFWPDSPDDRGLVLLARRDLDLPPAEAPGLVAGGR
jgi:hypothetical protein